MPKFVYPKAATYNPNMSFAEQYPLPPPPYVGQYGNNPFADNPFLNAPYTDQLGNELSQMNPISGVPDNFGLQDGGVAPYNPSQHTGIPLTQEYMDMIGGPVNVVSNESVDEQPDQVGVPQSDTSEMDRLVQQLRDLRQRQAMQLGPDLEHQRHMAGLVAGQGVGLDISPLAGLVDNWTGSNFSQTYKRPPTPEEKMRQLAGMQGGINKTQGALNQNEIEAIKAAIAGEKYNADQQYKDDMLGVQMAAAMKKKSDKGKILPGTAITAISGGETSLALVDNLSNVLEQNTRLIGPTEGLNALNPYSVEHKKIQSVIMMAKQIVGKTMEGGVLRKEDESKYQKILPNMQDTPPVARQKIKNLQQAVSGILYRDLENYGRAGYDVSGFEDKMKKYKSYSDKINKGSGSGESTTVDGLTPEEIKELAELEELEKSGQLK